MKRIKPFGEKAVIFCATQRTGSTMMVDDFQNLTGRERTESEAFYRLVLAPKEPGVSWQEALARVQALREGEAIFFDKVMYHYLPKLARMIDPGGPAAEGAPFARFFAGATWVHIRRANVFDQAVSKYFAELTNIWDRKHVEDPDYNRSLPIDIEKLQSYVYAFLREDLQWEQFFQRNGIRPLQVFYEDAVANFPHYLSPLMQALQIEPVAQPGPRRMEKVGNDHSARVSALLRDMCTRDVIHNSHEMRNFFRNKLR